MLEGQVNPLQLKTFRRTKEQKQMKTNLSTVLLVNMLNLEQIYLFGSSCLWNIPDMYRRNFQSYHDKFRYSYTGLNYTRQRLKENAKHAYILIWL